MRLIRVITIALILLFIGVRGFCQNDEKINYKIVDSVTYADYTSGKWEKVVINGEQAIDHKIDYFYLRMRMGIANFNLGNYYNAASDFEKALKFNSTDQTAEVYLYDTYNILGKNTKANKLSSDFSAKTLTLIQDKRKFLEAVYAGGGALFSNNYKENSGYQLRNNGDTLAGYKTLNGNKVALFTGLSLSISPSLSLYVGWSLLDIQKRITFQYSEARSKLDSVWFLPHGFRKFYSIQNKFHQQSFDEKIVQNELYLNAKLQLEAGWAITGFSNMIFVNSVGYDHVVANGIGMDTSLFISGNVVNYFTYTYSQNLFIKKETSFIDYIVGVNLEKDINIATFNLFGSYSSLNELNQMQVGVSSIYYLNKASTAYGSTGIMWFNQKVQQNDFENRIIFNQKIGSKIYKGLWGEASFLYGNLNNANINNGLLPYNQADKTNFKGEITARLTTNKHIELNLSYGYVSYEGVFYIYQNLNNTSNTFDYQSQNLIGRIVWKL